MWKVERDLADKKKALPLLPWWLQQICRVREYLEGVKVARSATL
jgi:hypothetical protein